MVIMATGAAFAFDTDTYYSPPDALYYEGALSGAANISVEGIDTVATKINGDTLDALLTAVQDNNAVASLAYVSFNAPTGTNVTYTQPEDELLYNFAGDTFDDYEGMRYRSTSSLNTSASRSITFSATGSSPAGYDDPSAASGKMGFVSIKSSGISSDSGAKQQGNDLGCSTMTMGALALFMLPMLAVRRGRK